LNDEIKNSVKLNNELIELRSLRTQNENIKNQYEAVKGQLNHLETFKSELSKSREEVVKIKSDYEKSSFGLKTRTPKCCRSIK
jgi:prefoldin subunit 5